MELLLKKVCIESILKKILYNFKLKAVVVLSYIFNAANRGGSRTAATSKMERLVIIVNGFQPLTIITKRSILDVATVLDPPLAKLVQYGVKPCYFLFFSLSQRDFIISCS